jgi:hypothetical protein
MHIINAIFFQYVDLRYYGGLGIFIKSNIRPGIKILENTHKDFQWLKLDKNFFNFNKDIFLCLAYIYIIPSNSSYKQGDEDILEIIEKNITNEYKDKGNIILCGDMNARSGSEPDFIQNDNYDIYVPVNDDYVYDLVQEKRQSQDDKIDSRGKQLLELCIATQMRILNGRVIGDLYGRYTCHKTTGSSVVDYIILSEELLSSIFFLRSLILFPTFQIATVNYHLVS